MQDPERRINVYSSTPVNEKIDDSSYGLESVVLGLWTSTKNRDGS